MTTLEMDGNATEAEQEQVRRASEQAKERETFEARFWLFHFAHPAVYDFLVDFTRQWKEAGGERIGIQFFYGRLRWQQQVDGLPNGMEPFKLNDHFQALYSRLIMNQEPDLRGFYPTRRRKRR